MIALSFIGQIVCPEGDRFQRRGPGLCQRHDVACASPTVCYAVGTLRGLSGYVI